MSSVSDRLFPRLPEGWTATPVRYAATCLDGKRVPLNVGERSSRQGDYPYWGANGIVDGVDEYLFDESLVLLGEDGAPFFDKSKPVAFFVSGRIWVNNHIHVLRVAPRFDARFVVHSLNATDYGPWIEGSTRDKLTQDKMGSILLPTPPLPQQRAIADYLDRETARLDALVEAKERVLGLLAEKRRALITRAVTRGLDNGAPLKDTGIKWIPQAQRHWRPSKMGRLFKQAKRQGFSELMVLSVYREYGVIERASRDDNANRVPEDLDKYQLVEVSDLVINKMKAWQGSLGVSELRGITSPDYVVLRPLHREHPRFLHFLLRNQLLTTVYLSMSNGIRTSQWRLEPDRFLDLGVLLPPLDEQRAIVAHIEAETTKLEALRVATDRTITLLRERRAALIAAVVTGQLEVA